MTWPSVRVSVLRLVSVALVLAVLMNWVGHQLRRSMDNSSQMIAEDWPTASPDESLRVYSLDGLSIIAPPGWYASISEDSIRLLAPDVPPGYLNPSEIRVNKVHDPYRHPRPLPRTTPFEDGYAFLKILHVRSTPHEPVRHEAHVVLEQNGAQYEIIFRSHKYFAKRVPHRIWQYLETFEKAELDSLATAVRNESDKSRF